MGAFAGIAALLAAVGLYGVLSSVVRQRLFLSAVGVAGGFTAALVLTRAMSSMLVGVTVTDPATFAAMIALSFLIAAVASWALARRAAGPDPTATLRLE
jgi:putative ABC transport system permease protein